MNQARFKTRKGTDVVEPPGDTAAEKLLPNNWEEQIQAVLHKFPEVVPPDKEIKPTYPPARAVDHEIPLLPGKEAPNRAAYRMSQEELAELRKQLQD